MVKCKMLRVLQHDKQDQIRIGMAFCCTDLNKTIDATVAQYEKDMAWCGGFALGVPEYYKRIALVDAETLKVEKYIYQEED